MKLISVGLFVAFVISLCSCQQEKSKENINTKNTTEASENKLDGFKIISEEVNQALSKSVIVVRLDGIKTRSYTRAIAMQIKKERPQFAKIWISFLLPDTPDGSGAWATINFTPDIVVNMIGASKTALNEMSKSQVSGEVISKWVDPDPILPNMTYLVQEDDKIILKMVYSKTQYTSASTQIRVLNKSTFNGLVKYTYENKSGEFVVIEKNGNLSWYDSEGKFKELVKK